MDFRLPLLPIGQCCAEQQICYISRIYTDLLLPQYRFVVFTPCCHCWTHTCGCCCCSVAPQTCISWCSSTSNCCECCTKAITDFYICSCINTWQWIYCYHNCIGLRTTFAVCNSHCICCCHCWTNTGACCCCSIAPCISIAWCSATTYRCQCCAEAITDFYICSCVNAWQWINRYCYCIGLRTPFAICYSNGICCCRCWTHTGVAVFTPLLHAYVYPGVPPPPTAVNVVLKP